MSTQRPNRRHFLRHVAATSALAGSASGFVDSLWAHAPQLKRENKAAVLVWLGGGASTIDMWDLKPGSDVGGPFRPIATSGDVEICEHLPQLAQQFQHLAIVRSMRTREADHGRGRYYMHTGYVPNPSVTHPSYGAVVSHELSDQTATLDIPPFVSIGGTSEGAGFLGAAYAPLVVDAGGQVRNLRVQHADRLGDRMAMLASLEKSFARQNRGLAATEHAKILDKTVSLMTSKQLDAFRVADEPEAARERYGDSNVGRGCLLARRLIEAGVPFVEVGFDGWDNHQNVFETLQNDRLPQLDRALGALVEDLDQRGRLDDTVVVCMGEFGRTPRINANSGRDHWARGWSVVLGGGGINGGIAVGETNEIGEAVADTWSSEDLMASVCHALGISLDTTYTSRSGRPMKIAGGGRIIEPLFA
ncbi:MAG: DUF1501 domain-containing protein [Planctomycetales bacterium]|nr:DUF1501 domain-containing protein [Planctomycetales bacterium]